MQLLNAVKTLGMRVSTFCLMNKISVLNLIIFLAFQNLYSRADLIIVSEIQ